MKNLGGYTMLEGIKSFLREIKEQAEEGKRQKEEVYREIANGNLPVVESYGILLKKGEYCHFYGTADRVITHTKRSYTTNSVGGSLRVAKGLFLRMGSGNVTPIETRSNVAYNGELFITNKRIVFLNSDKPCTIPLNKITGLEEYTNGFGLYKDNTYYLFATDEIKMIHSVVDGIFKKYELD